MKGLLMKSKRKIYLFSLILIGCYVFSSCERKSEPQIKMQLNQKIYVENADAKTDIANAISVAQQSGKNILLMFGGNWCVWCHRLHRLLAEDETIRTFLNENYILVMIDVGKRDKNLDLNEKYGNPYQHGFPVLVVLDKEGNQLYTQETGSLEYTQAENTQKGHHPGRVLQFLKDHASVKL